MDQPLKAHTLNEARYYLMVTPCQACGKGPLIWDSCEGAAPPPRIVEVLAHCQSCGRQRRLTFAVEHELRPQPPDSQLINPAQKPSRIVDLGQWLSLFYLLTESARRQGSASQARRENFKAVLCLDEALKFYSDNELPPPDSFFTQPAQQAFRQHPENFARSKLLAMKARLPALPAVARRVARDERAARPKRWWQFWRRRTST